MAVVDDPQQPTTAPLTLCEQELREAVRSGEPFDRLTGDPRRDDPAEAASWGPERTVRGQVLRALLTDGTARRTVSLSGVHITGSLDLEATTIAVPLRFISCGFAAPVSLEEARLPSLSILKSRVPWLVASHLETRGSVRLDQSHLQWIALLGANVGGFLTLLATTVENEDEDGVAVDADGITVAQDMFCRNGFRSTGMVRLLGAHIGGQLSFANATLTNPGDVALGADNIVIEQSLTLSPSFAATGEVRLLGAHVRGQVDLEGATLRNEGGSAFDAERSTLENSLLGEHLTVEGEMNLTGATIRGDLVLADTSLSNPGAAALSAAGLVVEGDATLERAVVRGGAYLQDAHITGSLNLIDARFDASGAKDAFQLQSAQVDKTLWLLPASTSGNVDLSLAHVGVLEDDPQQRPQTLLIRGFVYDAFPPNADADVEERLAWLEQSSPTYAPQPYEQLISVYRRTGHDDAARTVAIAKERRRHESGSWAIRGWGRFLRWTVGYGYEPWLAGYWLLVLLAIGSVAFGHLHPSHIVAAKSGHDPRVPQFHGLIYALDLLIPFINLHERDAWVAQGVAQWFTVAFTLTGWILTTVVLGALTGLLKRD